MIYRCFFVNDKPIEKRVVPMNDNIYGTPFFSSRVVFFNHFGNNNHLSRINQVNLDFSF